MHNSDHVSRSPEAWKGQHVLRVAELYSFDCFVTEFARRMSSGGDTAP